MRARDAPAGVPTAALTPSQRRAPSLGRASSTVLIDDPAFAELPEARLLAQGRVPEQLSSATQFLLFEHFAPHFDGATASSEDVERGATHGRVGALPCMLYLSDAFEGGETHYSPGQGSEVERAVGGADEEHRQATELSAVS